MLTLLILLFSILVLLMVYKVVILYKKKTKSVVLPPGPTGLPIIGNLHQIVKNAPLKFSQWAKQYGKLYTIHFGNKPALVINDAALMKKIFGMTVSTGKFRSDLFDVAYQGPYGLVNTDGHIWQEQRTFFLTTLKTVGLNRTALIEPLILEEIEDLCEWIKLQMRTHGIVRFGEQFKKITGNILWCVAAGEREKTDIAELTDDWVKRLNVATNSGLAFFSWLRYVAPKMSGYDTFVKASSKLHEFVRKYFDDPKRVEGHHYDVISAYIDRVNSTHDKKSSFHGMEGFKHSFSSVMGLLLAGTETTATVMNWMVFYLNANSDVQDKVHREIDEVIGEFRDPTLEDRKRMPYTEAVIEETFRMSSLAPFGVIQTLLEDTSFLQYNLPKGLLLIPNIYHVHNDPEVWGDPENFRPERFLIRKKEREICSDDSCSIYNKMRDNMVTFQPGKRTCPGETLARDVTFLFTTKLFKTFQFSPENGKDREDYLKPEIGYIIVPQKLGVVATARKNTVNKCAR